MEFETLHTALRAPARLARAPQGGVAVALRRTFVLDVDEYLKVRMDPNMPRFENADKLPPSTMIGVTRLSNPEFLIEIDLMAIVEA